MSSDYRLNVDYIHNEEDECDYDELNRSIEAVESKLGRIGILDYNIAKILKDKPREEVNPTKTILEISWVHVEDECKNQGVGTNLYKEVCKIAKRCKVDEVRGRILSQTAFKTRNKIFNTPKRIISRVTFEDVSQDYAMSQLPNCLLSSFGGPRGHVLSSEGFTVIHDMKDAKC